jgi:hypothetical protein
MKIIIDNKSSESDLIVLSCVEDIIRAGRISNYGKQYCYATTFAVADKKIIIYTDLNKKSDKFTAINYEGN